MERYGDEDHLPGPEEIYQKYKRKMEQIRRIKNHGDEDATAK